MIEKSRAQDMIKEHKRNVSRSAGKKINDWISGIMKEAATMVDRSTPVPPMDEPSSMEGPPSIAAPPWKGTHGDV